MLSLQDIAAIKFATVICNDPELKRKILHAFDGVTISGDKYDVKQKWDEIVQKQAMVTLRSRRLPKILREKVMNLVPAIGMSMLNWAVYHENILKFPRQYSIDFLNSSFFTQQGNIDDKKAAEELMKDKDLSVEQKYKIACLYCFTDHILVLFKQMTKEDREKLCSIGFQSCSQPALVTFWSDYLMREVDELRGWETLSQYHWFQKAIQSGSKAAVEYCFKKKDKRIVTSAIVDAAVEAVRNRIRSMYDTFVFRDRSYGDDYYNHSADWVPSEYYVDIVCFLLSKMTKDQKIEFLKKDIVGDQYEWNNYEEHNHSRVLQYFLNWPYQDHFMKTAELMWDFLPEKNYADLLLKICDKIEPEKERNLQYVEQKNYDYRGLLKEFWYQSPERYKRYVLCNQRIYFLSTLTDNAGVTLLVKLLSLKRFTFEDGQIIGVILSSADDNEKEAILSSSREWRSVLIELIKDEKLEILDRFVLSHFSSMQVSEFKRELISSRDFHDAVFDLVKNDNWDAVESALKWSPLAEEEVNQFKKELIYSEVGKCGCFGLVLSTGAVEVANKFIEWCIASEEEIREYKDKLIFSNTGMQCCKILVLEDKLEIMDKITNCWLLSQEKIQEFKEKFQSLKGHSTCELLISLYSERNSTGKCEEVEQFLTWCFSSQEKIVDFKKCLLRDSGTAILLNLIASSRWAEAETFFGCLGLSIEEIKKLKKDTVLDREFILFFHTLISREDEDPFFKKGTIELILRWCLTDKGTVLEFKQKFENWREGLNYHGGELQDVLCRFDLIIEQHLKHIHEEETGVKRKSETVFSPNKKLCNFKLENLD